MSAEVVVTRKSNTIRNFHCTVLQCPVVLTSLESSLVSTTLSILKMVKGRHGRDQFTKPLFESGYKFSVPLDADVSVEVVVTRKSNTIRNIPCTVLQCPVVLTSLKASLVSTTVSILKKQNSQGYRLNGFWLERQT